MRRSPAIDTNEHRRGLTMEVYRPADESYTSCSRGVTSRHTTVLLLGPGVNGPVTVEDAEELGRPVLYLHRWLMEGNGEDTLFASPDPDPNTARYSFGGNFIYTCDSRRPCHYPIPVHDRKG